jgi:epoxyqueuosine reductase
MQIAETIKQRALQIGFDLAGIAPVEVWRDLEFSGQWVEKGYAGEMHYLENPKRADPRRVLPSAKSVISVGLVYNADLPYSTEVRSQGSEVGRGSVGGRERPGSGGLKGPGLDGSETDNARVWISRYAWGRDYHQVMRSKLDLLRSSIEDLEPGVETRAYVDTGPIVERAFARHSGIGWMGKNTCLINEARGSWFFLGVILTSLELAPDLPAPDRCGSCTRCIDSCPTEALVEPYVMDASRCIAYLTIELRGSIPGEFRSSIGANVIGCDICQDVCPWNGGSQHGSDEESDVRSQKDLMGGRPSEAGHPPRRAATTGLPEFQPMLVDSPVSSLDDRVLPFSLFNPPLEALASLSEEDFRRAFAHSPIKRAKYRGWLRNLCVAMGNSGDRRFLPRLERLAEHDDPVVREHAQWALGQLEVT